MIDLSSDIRTKYRLSALHQWATGLCRVQLILLLTFFCFEAVAQEREVYHLTYTVGDGLPSNYILDVVSASDGRLWIATDQGVCSFDGEKFQSVDMAGVRDLLIVIIKEDPNGHIWFASKHGELYRIDDLRAIPHPQNDKILEATRGYYVPERFDFISIDSIIMESDRQKQIIISHNSVEEYQVVETESFGEYDSYPTELMGSIYQRSNIEKIRIKWNGKNHVFSIPSDFSDNRPQSYTA